MARIPHSFYDSLFGVAQLVLVGNALLLLGCAPLVVLLVATDPSLSWPLLALAAALTGPAVAGGFGAFRAHREGERAIVRPFFGAVRDVGLRALAVSALVAAVVTVATADVLLLVPTGGVGALFAPLLTVTALLAIGVGAVALTALVEAPSASLRDVLRASAVTAVRRWPFTLASLLVGAAQAGVFAMAPALAVGLTAAACLYVVWAGARYSLQPMLRPVAA